MCAKKPSLKKNGSATERNDIYKISHCGRKEVNYQIYFSLKMQNRRGDMQDMLVDISPPNTRVLLKCGCSFSIILMWATIQRTEWCFLLFYSKTVVYTSSLLLAPGSVHLELIQPEAYLLSGIFWVGAIPTAGSLHGGRRKGTTCASFGEADLQHLCQGFMVQYQRIK